MLRQEELMKQPVDLQQAVAVQPQTVIIKRQKASIPQLTEWLGKSLFNIDSKLALEVCSVNAAEFHLKNQFPNHALVPGRR